MQTNAYSHELAHWPQEKQCHKQSGPQILLLTDSEQFDADKTSDQPAANQQCAILYTNCMKLLVNG